MCARASRGAGEQSHDTAAYAQAHETQSRPIEGVSIRFHQPRLRIRGSRSTVKGHIDPELWQKSRTTASAGSGTATTTRSGGLRHKPGGAEHARWVFDYDTARADDDEAGYRFGVHAFVPGEYVSIRDDDDELHTFRVMAVGPGNVISRTQWDSRQHTGLDASSSCVTPPKIHSPSRLCP